MKTAEDRPFEISGDPQLLVSTRSSLFTATISELPLRFSE